MSIEDFNVVSAKLASWGYVNILWNAQTIISAAEIADWDPHKWPFEQCIRLIASAALAVRQKAGVALGCLKLLRRSTCGEFRQSAVIQAVLNAVGNRREVAWMHDNLDAAFGIDFPSAEFLRPELKYWLDSHVG